MAERARDLWVLVTPAPDLPDQWIGHCLELDIMSVGTSISHALEMTAEAVSICVGDDLEHGRDPFARAKAPASDWQTLEQLKSAGTRRQPSEGELVIAATQLPLISNHVGQVEKDVPRSWMVRTLSRDSELRL